MNGTIGLYDRLDRVWRVKSKHSVCALSSFDLDGDGIPELISGWSNGRVRPHIHTCVDIIHTCVGMGTCGCVSASVNPLPPPLISQVEVRRADSGEVVYRDMLSCSVSSILRADYRGDGVQQVVVCGMEGEVRHGGMTG